MALQILESEALANAAEDVPTLKENVHGVGQRTSENSSHRVEQRSAIALTEVDGQPRPHGNRAQSFIAAGALICIAASLILRLAAPHSSALQELPLIGAIVVGGIPLLFQLVRRVAALNFGTDLLAGISIVTAVLLGQHLAGAIIVLMLAGGAALEGYALRKASAALRMLARRTPTTAQRWEQRAWNRVAVSALRPGDVLLMLPHEMCPADGFVVEGHGTMDESLATGESFPVSKAAGADVISGAINGNSALTIRIERSPTESRYAQIMRVMQEAEQSRTRIRRIGDRLGALFTPLALGIALATWLATGDPLRFLSVIVVATPCPLLIAIPVALMGSISLCARRGIIIRDAGVLERLDRCKVIIFDKTGTLTYGKPRMTEVLTEPATDRRELLYLAASLEQYSRHPLASAVLEAAEAAGAGPLAPAQQIDEPSGLGLRGVVGAHSVVIGGRKHIPAEIAAHLPQATSGMECIILKDGRYVGLLRFRDEPRQDLARFITHLTVSHGVRKTMMVTGDGAAEAHRIGKCGGVGEVFYSQSPENKLAIVAQETRNGDTLYIGDGINDAPALAAASVGIAMGAAADVTTAAAGAVILEPSLLKLDELLHIASHLHRVLLQSAVGGIALSAGAMVLAAAGFINPASGAVIQELVDLAAVVNALRTGLPRGPLVDM